MIVTKDGDFAHKSALGDPAPIVVWVRAGNTRHAPLLSWFEPLIDRIAVMVEAGDRVIELR